MSTIFARRLLAELAVGLLVAACACSANAQVAAIDGQIVFLGPRKGNCLACHRISADSPIKSASRIGPELAGIKARYPDRAQLRAVIWNLSDKLPGTIMPPYGKHRILTEAEIDAVVLFLETL